MPARWKIHRLAVEGDNNFFPRNYERWIWLLHATPQCAQYVPVWEKRPKNLFTNNSPAVHFATDMPPDGMRRFARSDEQRRRSGPPKRRLAGHFPGTSMWFT
jgi:hypothetical protein